MAGRFGKVLRKARQKAKLRLIDVAEKMDWSVVYLSDLERGRRNPPSADKIVKLAKIIDVPAGILLEAASKDKKRIELPLEAPPKLREAALMLARSWDKLTDEEAEKILQILQEREVHQ